MISLKGIEKIIPQGHAVVHALKGVNLNIETGEIFGILGEKGAGKSALIRCINLLERPSCGSVILDSCELTTLSTEALRNARRSIGMIFQQANLLSSRTVFENIAFPLELSGASVASKTESIEPLLALTQLEAQRDAYPHTLNPEQKQRVAIARALVQRPKVLLCEEATIALDPTAKAAILELLKAVNIQFNLSIVLITHEIDVIRSLCDRMAVLEQGEIIEQGSVVEVLSHPQSDLSKALVRKATLLDLPHSIRQRLQALELVPSNPILRISLASLSAEESFIADAIRKFQVSINIIQAYVEQVQSDSIGILIAEMVGPEEERNKAIQFLETKDLHIEVLGYVPRST